MTKARNFIVGISAAVVLLALGGVGASADENGTTPVVDGCVLGPDAHCPGVDLTGMDLSGRDLTRADLSGAKAAGVNFSGAVLEWTDLVGANLANANLTGAQMRSTDFTEAVLTGADLRGATGVSADFSWANLTSINATQASLSGAFFGNATVSNANFTGAVLAGSDLTNADLLLATTDASTLCPDSQPGPCRARTENEPTTNGGDLPEGRVINGCQIAPKTKCPGVDLRDQNLSAVRLNGSDLSKANLSKADLTYADLSGANLSGADLTYADLSDAVLNGTNLAGAKLCQTRINGGIDNSGCDDRCVDATTAGDWQPRKLPGRFLASLVLLPYRQVPSGMRPLDGATLAVQHYTPLYAQIGDAFGGDGRQAFNLPRASGSWSGMRGLPSGPRTCLTWAIAIDSTWPPYGDVPFLPNEVFFTASPVRTIQGWDWPVELLPELSSRIAPGISAFVVQGNTDRNPDVGIGELKLFRGTSLPRGFLPADGRELPIDRNEVLFSVLAGYEQDSHTFRLPKIEAPAGYTWAIATEGTYPNF